MNREEKEKFTRRAFLLALVKGLLLIPLIGRLHFLQISNRKYYEKLSDKNRIKTLIIIPERGKIYDRFGKILVTNKTSYKAFLRLDNTLEALDSLEKISGILELEPSKIESIINAAQKRKNPLVLLKEPLTWKELTGLELNYENLEALEITKGSHRLYLYPNEICHLVGYVSPLTEKEIDNNPELNIPGLKIGRAGLEYAKEEHLRGELGFKEVEVNVKREILRTLKKTKENHGQDLTLTIDFDLQRYVYEQMKQRKSGCAAVMNIKSGEILASVSYPSFDTNLFTSPLSQSDWNSLLLDPLRPLNNKIISGLYSPGSIFKLIIGLAGLNESVINRYTYFHCPGYFDLGSHRFHCWKWRYGGHGKMNLESALSESCDVYFYHLAKYLGIDKIIKLTNFLSLAQKTGIELPGEKEGLIPSPYWKKNTRRQNWTLGDTINISIGQGDVLLTPLQLLRMIALFSNNFTPITPHIIKGNQTFFDPLPVSEEYQALILEGMKNCVNRPMGTAYKARIQEKGFEMGGKTGSTQVKRISLESRRRGIVNQDPTYLKEHALFLGYAPIHNPRYAISLLVEHGGGGAKTAAPLARDILLFAQKGRK